MLINADIALILGKEGGELEKLLSAHLFLNSLFCPYFQRFDFLFYHSSGNQRKKKKREIFFIGKKRDVKFGIQKLVARLITSATE